MSAWAGKAISINIGNPKHSCLLPCCVLRMQIFINLAGKRLGQAGCGHSAIRNPAFGGTSCRRWEIMVGSLGPVKQPQRQSWLFWPGKEIYENNQVR